MAVTCDIILLSYESPDLLRKCVESVLSRTRTPSRLIIVDNASKDPEVARYLAGVSARGPVEVTKVFNGKNLGFAGGINTGLRLAEAPYVCLLNNDCVVTEGWLEEMIAVAGKRSDIGLVCPQSNTFGSRPSSENALESHAAGLSSAKGRYTEMGHAVFFACLLKREVIDKAGLLDEAYAGVCYEDTDYSLRAQRLGYISVVAEGAYVFHKEQASRRKLKGKEEVYARNRKLFEDKWGKMLRVLCIDRPSSGIDKVSRTYESLKCLARRSAIIDFWVIEGCPASGDADRFFGDSVKHSDIGVKFVPAGSAALKAIWKVLTKKKKYDAVIAEKGFLASALGVIAPLRGAKVFVREGATGLSGRRGAAFDLKEAGVLAAHLRGNGK